MVEKGSGCQNFQWWLKGYVVTYEVAWKIARTVVLDSVCGSVDDSYRPRVMSLFVEPTRLPRSDLPSIVACSAHERDGALVICAAMGTGRCRKFGGIGRIKRLMPDIEEIKREGRVGPLSLFRRKSS